MRTRRRRTGRSEQFTAAIGIVTAGTILVSAIIAAFVAFIVAFPETNAIQSGVVQLGFLSALTSVAIYVFGVVFALSTLNRLTETHRALGLSRAATAFFLQAFSAVIFAGLVIAVSFSARVDAPNDPIQSSMIQTNHHLMLNDARHSHARAIERLQHGHTREAAGLAWVATRRATDTLITVRTGETPATIALAVSKLDELARRDTQIKRLVSGYRSRYSQLGRVCFYDGICNSQTEMLIRETEDYITDAESLIPNPLK